VAAPEVQEMAPVMTAPPASISAIERLSAAEAEWRASPNDRRSRVLLARLYEVTQEVVERRAGTASGWSSPLSGGGHVALKLSVQGGRRVFSDGSCEVDLRDVIHEYVLATRQRYARDPEFRVRSLSYVRAGIALQANTMLRSSRRQLGGTEEGAALKLERPPELFCPRIHWPRNGSGSGSTTPVLQTVSRLGRACPASPSATATRRCACSRAPRSSKRPRNSAFTHPA